MACDISNGRLEACKDGISGLDAVYFINYGINYPTDVTFSATPGQEDVITAVDNITDLYKLVTLSIPVITSSCPATAEKVTSVG